MAVVLLMALSTAAAQGPFGHLEFERADGAAGSTQYVLGINAFTAAQLQSFLASIERFLSLAEELAVGDRVTLRQEGSRGYIALTAYDGGTAPSYVLTLAAEEPTGISTRSGLEALWVLLADQIELAADAGVPSLATP